MTSALEEALRCVKVDSELQQRRINVALSSCSCYAKLKRQARRCVAWQRTPEHTCISWRRRWWQVSAPRLQQLIIIDSAVYATSLIIISAKEVMFSPVSVHPCVCLSVSAKSCQAIFMKHCAIIGYYNRRHLSVLRLIPLILAECNHLDVMRRRRPVVVDPPFSLNRPDRTDSRWRQKLKF